MDNLLHLGDSFESEVLNDYLRLDPLGSDELLMLEDPSLITDTATEDAFRLDRL